MSTNLNDLPGPSENLNDLPGPSENINETDDMGTFENQEHHDYQDHQSHQGHQDQGDHEDEDYNYNYNYNKEYFENAPLKKKESSPFDILDIISNEIKYHGKENLLLLVILFISTLRYSDEYTRKIMTLLSFSVTNLTMISVIKALLLLILFIICKNYVLPLISLT